MKLSVLALAPLMLCLTNCNDRTPPPAVLKVVTPDKVLAKYDGCPKVFPLAPNLPPLSAFKLPDGREVVLLDTVYSRDLVVAKYILQGRDAWHKCETPVRYTEDWISSVLAK